VVNTPVITVLGGLKDTLPNGIALFRLIPILFQHHQLNRVFRQTFPASSSNSTGTISIHTVNAIQGSNSSILVQEEPGIRKAILSYVDNAIFIAKGSVKSAIPVNVNAKIINQQANGRVDTTQGIAMTKRLIATELVNVINATTPNFVSHFAKQPARITVDNQAICNGIASPTKAACSFTINLHS